MVAAINKKNTIQLTGFALADDGFTYYLKFYRFEDVTETRIIKSVLEHKVVFVGSDYHYSISIIIGMRSGELLQVTEQPTWLSDSKMNSIEYIENMFFKISRESYQNRFNKYTSSIKRVGYFDYNGWRFCIKKQRNKKY